MKQCMVISTEFADPKKSVISVYRLAAGESWRDVKPVETHTACTEFDVIRLRNCLFVKSQISVFYED